MRRTLAGSSAASTSARFPEETNTVRSAAVGHHRRDLLARSANDRHHAGTGLVMPNITSSISSELVTDERYRLVMTHTHLQQGHRRPAGGLVELAPSQLPCTTDRRRSGPANGMVAPDAGKAEGGGFITALAQNFALAEMPHSRGRL